MSRKIIDFYADWCIPCKGIAVHLEKAQQLGTIKVEVEKVDVQQEREKAEAYNVSNLPTLIFIEDDEVKFKMTGLSDRTVKAIYNFAGIA